MKINTRAKIRSRVIKAVAAALAAICLFLSASMSLDDIKLAYDKLIAVVNYESKFSLDNVSVDILSTNDDPGAANAAETLPESDAPLLDNPLLLSQAVAAADTDDDAIRELFLNIVYNSATGRLYDKDQRGLLGIGFDYDARNGVWYTPVNAWQRNFGYFHAYDSFAFLAGIFITTVRAKFVYEGKEWMIQVWRGQYGITSGAEMGIYNRDLNSAFDFYNGIGDEDMLPMSMKVYRGDKLYFERSEDAHWWLTGFVLPGLNSASDLKCDMSVTLKDAEMRDLFIDSMVMNGFSLGTNLFFTGNKVSFIWD
ncbi:MAG: DUF4474 domain-containing protein [Oscillospiraceae bacterium]|nr:DUF4474 domain-containing protein [Oscillospiraceae bacterium]